MSNYRDEYENEIKIALKAKAENIHPPGNLKQKVFQELELLNKKGEMLGRVTVDTLDIDDPFDQILKQLKPGMGKAIYVTANNPEKIISNQTNYEQVKWHAGIKELIDHIRRYRIKLPVHTKLHEIKVMYGFDSLEEDEIKEMYREAELTGNRIVVRDLRKSNQLVGAMLAYEKDGIRFELHVLTTTKSRIHVPDMSRHLIERTSVGHKEGIYLSDSTNCQLLWVDDDNKLNIQYEIRASNVSKEWILELAETLRDEHSCQ